MKARAVSIIELACIFLLIPTITFAIRIKDMATIEGVRENQLIGYGLVVGLNGSGDKSGTEFTVQSIVNMLKNMGVAVNSNAIKVKNVAAVMATATLPPFAKAGSKIDVTISSLGDAKSLEGGTLLLTPLKAANDQIFAIAQGPVSVGGFNKGGGGGAQKNHVTVGFIPNGATIERELGFSLKDIKDLTILLNKPDFTTANRIKEVVDNSLGAGLADAYDSGTIKINIPLEFRNDCVKFIAQLEALEVEPDSIAKVIINERTGTIIMGKDVRISTVAIAHGNLSIEIKEEKEAEPQTEGLIGNEGSTEASPQAKIDTKAREAKVMVVPSGVKIETLVEGLNAIGVNPRDMIAILQAIKASGALQAELQIM